jgi:hypothetical protein
LPPLLQAREGDAPSYFNAIEASILSDLVQSLIAATAGAARQGSAAAKPPLRLPACLPCLDRRCYHRAAHGCS